MKFMFSQMAYFVAQESNKRNIRFMMRFFLLILMLVAAYTVLFHLLMFYEGRHYSLITGLYWTLTVMTTLGFGDITFASDAGKLFTVLVLSSGILVIMLVLPFTFIRYFYGPWLEAQANSMVPDKLPAATHDHVLLVGNNAISRSISLRLRQIGRPHWVLVDGNAEALQLYDKGFPALLGYSDSTLSYKKARVGHAALVVALNDDMKNTNTAATVREVSHTVPLASAVSHQDSIDILELAGCNRVFFFTRMLGEALARRVFVAGSKINVIAHFENLCVAEIPAQRTPYIGKTLAETDLRSRYGLNVAGIWHGRDVRPALPDSQIDERSILLVAGSDETLSRYVQDMDAGPAGPDSPVLILGGGTVGLSAAAELERRGIPYRIVEKNPARVPAGDSRFVSGSAADLEVLKAAGIDSTHAVMVTTHDDDVNVYLTIYCRKLRPDVQILSRSTLDRNVGSLYSAGASLVMSHATMAANAVLNMLTPDRVFMLTEGMNVFRVHVPPSLENVSLRDSGIRKQTRCNVVAVKSRGQLSINPDPETSLHNGDELILVGSPEAEKAFTDKYT